MQSASRRRRTGAIAHSIAAACKAIDFCGGRVKRRRALHPASLLASLFLAVAALSLSPVHAGGGPENVLVVVNANSWASKTIANYYVALRGIPSSNVVYIDWTGSVEATNIEKFRNAILGPVLQAIEQRKLDTQIDYVAYSADFPYEVRLQSDLENRQAPKEITPSGSINGLTYLWESVAARDVVTYVQMNANGYFRRTADANSAPASQGFRSWYGWSNDGRLLEAGGRHFLLSTVLGVISGRGNSVAEVIECLSRSASADGTLPRGTIYFARNEDIRSTQRHGLFPAAASALTQLNVSAEIVDGETPKNKPDVQGAMLGTHTVNWGGSGSTIQPGAICDHFTSYGGMLNEIASQTPLSEFIRYGAAGASGTVIEPYALPHKFPTAFMHVHYARGCSLAESYYQSLSGPYQLLIVGDPLCRPWATMPTVELSGVEDGATVSGRLSLRPTAQTIGTPVDRFELFVDGRRRARCGVDEVLELDTRTLIDGYHELRIVGIEGGAIESQGSLAVGIVVNNNGRSMEMSVASNEVRWGQPLEIAIDAPGASFAAIYHNKERIGHIQSEQGTVEIDPIELGVGPVVLEGLALGSGGPRQHALAVPLQIEVAPGDPIVGSLPAGRKRNGWQLSTASTSTVVEDLSKGGWLKAAGASPDESADLVGYLDVPVRDVYQFHVKHRGRLTLEVDGTEILEAEEAAGGVLRIVPAFLERGPHRVAVHVDPAPEVALDLRFGSQEGHRGPGVKSIRGEQFWHVAEQ